MIEVPLDSQVCRARTVISANVIDGLDKSTSQTFTRSNLLPQKPDESVAEGRDGSACWDDGEELAGDATFLQADDSQSLLLRFAIYCSDGNETNPASSGDELLDCLSASHFSDDSQLTG